MLLLLLLLSIMLILLLELLVVEVDFGWVVGLGGVGVVVCKNCVGLLLVLLGEVGYKTSDH